MLLMTIENYFCVLDDDFFLFNFCSIERKFGNLIKRGFDIIQQKGIFVSYFVTEIETKEG